MNNIKYKYSQHVQDTAPDMDKLWNKIENTIDEKETANDVKPQIRQTKKSYKKYTALAASLLVVISAAYIFANFNDNKTDTYDKSATESHVEEQENNTLPFDKNDVVKYESLSLSRTSTTSYNANYTADGDEYFVEENVLEKTDYFADVTILKATLNTTYAEYEMKINRLINKSGETKETDITIKSSTPYILQEDREYFIPLYEEDGTFYIAFENAPQIEISLDNELIFQNGWECLDEYSISVEKSQESKNDYYYDRMRYSQEDNLNTLIEKWKSL